MFFVVENLESNFEINDIEKNKLLVEKKIEIYSERRFRDEKELDITIFENEIEKENETKKKN